MGTFNDISNKTFGLWKVIKYKGNSKWECECQCQYHTIKDVHRYSLLSGKSTSCGKCNKKAKVKKDDKFSEWKVINEEVKNNKVLCECSCGKQKEVNIYSLLNGTSTNCGHLKNSERIIDITNKEFGELKPIKYIGNGKWECECSCGRHCIKLRSHLLDGRATSCGHDTIAKAENLIGQQFGLLKPIKYMGNKSWLCECKCENRKIIRSNNLKNNSTLSCGCILYTPTKEELVNKLVEFKNIKGYKPSIIDIANYLDISYKKAQYHLNKFELSNSSLIDNTYTSQGERELYRFISDIATVDVLHNVKNIIYPYELDIYIPDKKLALEFNGNYWHSELLKDKEYHQNKVIMCEKLGIQLIHIYEYEWNNDSKQSKIKDLLRNKLCNPEVKIYARNLKVSKIDNRTAIEFCNKYHLQDGFNSPINIGLFLDNNIVGIMTFGFPRFSNECQYELIRLAFKNNTSIIGGSSKLFRFFLKEYNPESIISYCNTDKFKGDVYTKLGFDYVGLTKPSYIWINHNDILTRYQITKSKLIKQGICTNDDSVDDVMFSLGYIRIYDSGNKKFIWKRENN